MEKQWPQAQSPLLLAFFAEWLSLVEEDYLLLFLRLLYSAHNDLRAQSGSISGSLGSSLSSSTSIFCSFNRTRISKIVCTAGLLLWAGILPASEPDAPSAQALRSVQAPSEEGPRAIENDKQVRALLNQMLVAWNAHDIEGYLKFFWASDRLLVVQDGVPIFGWRRLRERYLRFYADRNQMRTMTLEGATIEVLDDDFAEALCWWSSNSEETKSSVIDVTLFRRFSEGWAIVSREIFD
jgi:hypothetical protein